MCNLYRTKSFLRAAILSLAFSNPLPCVSTFGSPSEYEDPIAVYRAARESLSRKEFSQASDGFQKVIALKPGSLLALEACYFDIQARRQGASGSFSQTDDLARACDAWRCEALSLTDNTPTQRLGDFALRIQERLDSIQALEIQLAFSSQRWQKALSLLAEKEHRKKENGPLVDADRISGDLMRLECLVQLQRWRDAENLAESLQVTVDENLVHTPPSPWIEPFLLRVAEVAMVLGKWNVAESNVWKIRKHFPECKVSTQVDYVFARCLVHDAKFEEARQLLASILASQPNPTAELQVKVWWTIAETHLMQRNIPDAYVAYEQVAKLGLDSPWAELAKRQMAVCQQASGNAIVLESESNTSNSLRSTQKQTPKQPR